MTAKATAALASVLIVAAFLAGYFLAPDAEAAGLRADRGPTRAVPLATHEGIQTELAAARKREEGLNDDIDTLRQRIAVLEAPEGTDAAAQDARLKGPRFLFGAQGEALSKLDWEKVAESLHAMPPVLAELLRWLETGEGEPPVGEVQRWNGQLLQEALKLVQAEVPGTGANGTFSNPAVMSNMIHAALAKSGSPLTEQQIEQLRVVGQRAVDEDGLRLNGYAADVLGLQKVVDEFELKDRWFREVDGILSEQQQASLHPEATRNLTSVDLFSSAIMLGPLSRPVAFKDRADLEKKVGAMLTGELQLDAASRTVVEGLVRKWSEGMSDEFLSEPATRPVRRARVMDADRVKHAARLQLALMEGLTSQLSLTDEQRKGLREELAILVPFRKP